MLFNSWIYILLFLPLTTMVYFLLNKRKQTTLAKAWLALVSLVFYSWWSIKYLPLLLGSIVFNYGMGSILSKPTLSLPRKKWILFFAISADVLLLGYYKYYDFFIANVNSFLATNFSMLHLILPLGISFFTFTQIAFLVDAYKGKAQEKNFLSYVLFVTFFPHLIAGPILHHKEMMPQFDDQENKSWKWQNVRLGICIFVIGLFKKVVIADTFAVWANYGYDQAALLGFVDAWLTSLSYSLQLYFDFSGYCDMAIGGALILNIKLPLNFDSPYKSLNIQEFWRRWHMTLGRFLRDYIYIPLGGNRKGPFFTYFNLFMTFLIGGIWHGAGWMFVIWGALHGGALVVHRMWMKTGIRMHPLLAGFLTFQFVNFAWVFFRAENWEQANKVLGGMFGYQGVSFALSAAQSKEVALVALGLLVCVMAKNSMEITTNLQPKPRYAIIGALLTVCSLLMLGQPSEFLYFNF